MRVRNSLLCLALLLAANTARCEISEYQRRIETAERAAEDHLYAFAEQEALSILEGGRAPFADRVLALLVRTAAGRNDRAAAEKRFFQLLREHPKSAHLAAARLYYAQALVTSAETSGTEGEAKERLAEAQEHLGLVVRDASDSAIVSQAEFLLGMVASRSGEPERAITHFGRALKGDLPALMRSMLAYELAAAHRALGRYGDALEALPAALEKTAPEEVRRRASFLAGELRYSLRQWEQARAAYLAPELVEGRRDVLAERAKYCAAWTLWKHSEEAPPARKGALVRAALDEFLALIRSPSEEISGRAALKAAHIHIVRNEPEAALAVLSPLLSGGNFAVRAGYYAALANMAQGDMGAAERHLKTSLRSAREPVIRSELLSELAALYERQERYKEAAEVMEMLGRGAGEESKRWRALFNAARLELLAGDEAAASERLDAVAADSRAARHIPPDEVAYWRARLAESRAHRTGAPGDFLTAERLFKEFLRFDPSAERAKEAEGIVLSLYAASPLPEQKERGIALVNEMLADAGPGEKCGLLKQRAELEAASGLHSKAASSYRAAALLASEDGAERAEFFYSAAMELEAAGETASALAALDEIKGAPEDAAFAKRLLQLKARLLRAKGDYQAAADLHSAVSALSEGIPERQEALLAEAQERLRAGQLDKAREVLAAFQPQTRTAAFNKHYLLADAAYRLGEAAECLKEAMSAFEAAGKDRDLRSQALSLAGRARKALGQNEAALSLLTKAIDFASEEDRAGLLIEAAEAAFASARYQEARKAYLEVYYSPLESVGRGLRDKALSGAVQAGIELARETKHEAQKRTLLDETLHLLRTAPESEWKDAVLKRLKSIDD